MIEKVVFEAKMVKEECQIEYNSLIPLIVAAEAAVQQLDKKDLEFIKTMKNPS